MYPVRLVGTSSEVSNLAWAKKDEVESGSPMCGFMAGDWQWDGISGLDWGFPNSSESGDVLPCLSPSSPSSLRDDYEWSGCEDFKASAWALTSV